MAQSRLADRAVQVAWIVGDVTALDDVGRFDIWHDRAVFHFLTDAADRRRYVALAGKTVEPGGTAIMATFAPDGPERCSGLAVCRYDVAQLAEQCGPAFHLEHGERWVHATPAGVLQRFVYSTFSRVTDA